MAAAHTIVNDGGSCLMELLKVSASQVMNAPSASPEQNYAGDANFLRTEKLKTVVLGVMCVALFFLLMFLFVNTWPALVNFYQRLVCVNKKLVERRIATIRVWTISKVSASSQT
jgi:hypothetical protein